MASSLNDYDVIFLGGGLASCLAAYRLHKARPDVSLLVVEARERLGGDHTWSFHGADLPPADLSWVRPLATREWRGHSVYFPAFRRGLSGEYLSIRSTDFHRLMMADLGDEVRLGARVTAATATSVQLEGGERLRAKCVLDGRGFHPMLPGRVAYQKFVGLDLELEAPHGLNAPILMDATVPQLDGYRFIYCLPWTDTSVLVEDTRYSDGPDVDCDAYSDEILAYAARRGWRVARRGRMEIGALPIPLSRKYCEPAPVVEDAPIAIGVRGGFFHPTTGYSLPDAVQMASLLVETRIGARYVREAVEAYRERTESARAFYRFLNRMLFLGARPAERYRVLERFYRLSEGLVGRFYGGRTGLPDMARLLVGRPPISPSRAWPCIPDPEPGRWSALRSTLFPDLLPSEVTR